MACRNTDIDCHPLRREERSANMQRRADLIDRIGQLRAELAGLEDQLADLDEKETAARTPPHLPLRLDEYRRYGRQMILPGIGLPGQLKLKQANILVVGAGGLGCPVLLYLAGAGVGNITIVDNDTVELSNLHRQVLHNQSRVGLPKVESARLGIKSLNSLIRIETINERFTPALVKSQGNEPRLDLASFDLIVDCTDNATTRYLLSDLAIEYDVTLVSGGAVGLEGWVGVWNLPSAKTRSDLGQNTVGETARGPCLRCIYPQSQNDNSGNCEDDGILGTVVGTVGLLMANEAIKLLVGLHDLKPIMTLFSPLSSPMFRNLKLRGRKPGCLGCDPDKDSKAAYEAAATFVCGTEESDGKDSRVTARGLQEVMQSEKPYLLIDTRPEVEFGICSLPNSINIPHSKILCDPQELASAIPPHIDTYLVCRRGNDSLLDARIGRSNLSEEDSKTRIFDVRGGLHAWSALHPEFPRY